MVQLGTGFVLVARQSVKKKEESFVLTPARVPRAARHGGDEVLERVVGK